MTQAVQTEKIDVTKNTELLHKMVQEGATYNELKDTFKCPEPIEVREVAIEESIAKEMVRFFKSREEALVALPYDIESTKKMNVLVEKELEEKENPFFYMDEGNFSFFESSEKLLVRISCDIDITKYLKLKVNDPLDKKGIPFFYIQGMDAYGVLPINNSVGLLLIGLEDKYLKTGSELLEKDICDKKGIECAEDPLNSKRKVSREEKRTLYPTADMVYGYIYIGADQGVKYGPVRECSLDYGFKHVSSVADEECGRLTFNYYKNVDDAFSEIYWKNNSVNTNTPSYVFGESKDGEIILVKFEKDKGFTYKEEITDIYHKKSIDYISDCLKNSFDDKADFRGLPKEIYDNALAIEEDEEKQEKALKKKKKT